MANTIKRLHLIYKTRLLFLRGFPIRLTDSEFAIVYLITQSGEEGVSVDELLKLFSRSTMTTHVCNINKKAVNTSGIRLIERNGNHYRFC